MAAQLALSKGECDAAAIVSGIETAKGLLVGIGALAAIIADLATTGGLITLATLSFSSSYRLYLRNGYPTFWLAGPGSGIAVESPFQLAAGRWHHLVARYDGERLAISVDGQEAAVDHRGSIPVTPIWLEIGSTPFRNEFFIGTIDELVISGR